MLCKDLHPGLENKVMYVAPNNDFYGKKMFLDEERTAARTTKIDLSIIQSNNKLHLDAKLGKDDID